MNNNTKDCIFWARTFEYFVHSMLQEALYLLNRYPHGSGDINIAYGK